MKGMTNNIHPILMRHLLAIEEAMGFELDINSGYRDPEHNTDVGGVADSEHTYDPAEGVDVLCLRSATRFKMLKVAFERGIPRIGIGKTFLHFGIAADKPQSVVWEYYPSVKS